MDDRSESTGPTSPPEVRQQQNPPGVTILELQSILTASRLMLLESRGTIALRANAREPVASLATDIGPVADRALRHLDVLGLIDPAKGMSAAFAVARCLLVELLQQDLNGLETLFAQLDRAAAAEHPPGG